MQFQAGQKALLRADECLIQGNKHFEFPWTGSFDFKAVTASTTTLDQPEHWRLLSNTFHFNKLRSYQPRPGDVGPPEPPPLPALIQEGQAWYEVDRVVKHSWKGRRQPNGQRQLHYMVLFKWFSDSYNVWRPATLL